MLPRGEEYNIVISTGSARGETEYNRLEITIPKSGILSGNLALVSNGGEYFFKNWKVRGTKVKYEKTQQFGPIMGSQYTLSSNILKITAQLAPVSESDEPEVELQIRDNETGKWKSTAISQIRKPGFTAGFKLSSWNSSVSHDYRLVYHILDAKSSRIPYYYYGTIVSDPEDKEEIVVAAFTGNNNSHGSIGSEA